MSAAPEIRIMTDSQELAYEAAELFVWLGEQAMASNVRFRVALSGGTTPKGLYAALAGPAFSTKLAWPRVDFYFGDERCVPPDHPDSNFCMANETLFRPLTIQPAQVFRMLGEDNRPARAALQYEELLRKRFSASPPAWPRFDLVLLGLGEDGHTASLFPGTQALDEREKLVVATTAPQGVKDRLTLTAPAINSARAIVFLVSGSSKANAVWLALEAPVQNNRRVPARLIRPETGRLIWLLDRTAASELTMAKQGIVSHEE